MGLTVLAETGGEFVDFAPYVPCMAANGAVYFQAQTSDGLSGIWRSEGSQVSCQVRDGRAVSHPASDGSGPVCYYSESGLALLENYNVRTLAPEAGPLGPTMANGCIAFRAKDEAFLWISDSTALISAGLSDLQGLPVVNQVGDVLVRSREGISLYHKGNLSRLDLEVDPETLGNFPNLLDDGRVIFVANLQSGPTLGVWQGGETRLNPIGAEFETIRGALSPDLVFATPNSGQLGIYLEGKRLIGLGDSYAGGTVADLALNPVSMNAAGDFAIRLKLTDDRQFIVKFAP